MLLIIYISGRCLSGGQKSIRCRPLAFVHGELKGYRWLVGKGCTFRAVSQDCQTNGIRYTADGADGATRTVRMSCDGRKQTLDSHITTLGHNHTTPATAAAVAAAKTGQRKVREKGKNKRGRKGTLTLTHQRRTITKNTASIQESREKKRKKKRVQNTYS